LRLGVLGGGQLGRMMIQEAMNWDVRVEVMDPSSEASCRHLTHRFVQGDLQDAEAVVAFGAGLDVATVEIEHVSVEGLQALADQGVDVVPRPAHLALIQDKGLQKQAFERWDVPSAPYRWIDGRDDVGALGYPVVQKLRRGGYDGKGVQVLRSAADAAERAFDAPSVLEALVDIDKELSVLVARNAAGQTAVYPVVEAVFNPEVNLVDHLMAPATISAAKADEARALALKVVESMDFVGLLAVELFLDPAGGLWVNELAPRTHNSGHHTIEGNVCSQFEQHLRAVLNLPLGDTAPLHPAAAMLNLIGEADAHGTPVYEGMEAALAMPNVHVHLYGKSTVKPHRKMGHVTVTGPDVPSVQRDVLKLRAQLRVSGSKRA
jgi:5-(carboxyamino)imidazole ribonucleotide synthase